MSDPSSSGWQTQKCNSRTTYAPTNQAEETEKSLFYNQLQAVLESVHCGDALFVPGDFNAKIGEGSEIGRHAIGQEHENGQWLVHFSQQNGLVAASAWRLGHPHLKYTQRSPDGLHQNQIDYILARRSAIAAGHFLGQTRYRPTMCLVAAKVSLRLNRRRGADKPTRYDTRDDRGQLELDLRNRLQPLSIGKKK